MASLTHIDEFRNGKKWTEIPTYYDPDAEFGGSEARVQLERKLLWKLDSRMCILVIIYILNFVFLSTSLVLFRC